MTSYATHLPPSLTVASREKRALGFFSASKADLGFNFFSSLGYAYRKHVFSIIEDGNSKKLRAL